MKRYKITYPETIDEDPNGEWVKAEDVKEMIINVSKILGIVHQPICINTPRPKPIIDGETALKVMEALGVIKRLDETLSEAPGSIEKKNA